MEPPSPPVIGYSSESLKLKVPEQGFVGPRVGHGPRLASVFCTISYSTIQPISNLQSFSSPPPHYSQYVCLFAQSWNTCIFRITNPCLCKKANILENNSNNKRHEGFKHFPTSGKLLENKCQQSQGRGRPEIRSGMPAVQPSREQPAQIRKGQLAWKEMTSRNKKGRELT